MTNIIQEAVLYVVAGPIGNLQDLTDRAKEILPQMEVIFCEDSRVTLRLMGHLGLRKKLISCHAHNEYGRVSQVVGYLSEGHNVAYLSDAGTPGISDPGNLIVAEVAKAGFKVIPIPGPSAITALLSVCGFNLAKGFFFAGFLPRTAGKIQKLLTRHVVDSKNVLLAFESPYRIKKTLAEIASTLPDCKICLGRELTKVHEEIIRGTAYELSELKFLERGEFVFAIEG